MATITSGRVNTFTLRFDLKAGGDCNKVFEVIVFRSDFNDGKKIVTTYRIYDEWQIWEHNEGEALKKIAEHKEILTFSDYFEADSKYQHLCLKAFTESMSKRQVY